MKRFLRTMLLLVLAALFCLPMIACGDTPNDSGDSGETGTKAELSAGYKLVAKTAWEKLGFTDVLDEATTESLNVSLLSNPLPVIGVEQQEGSFNWAALRGNAGASIALINLIGDYYKNADFVITDKVVTFTIQDIIDYSTSTTGDVLMSMRPILDYDNGKIELQLRMKSDNYVNYYYFELGFDFTSETLTYFSFGLHVMGTYSAQRMDTDGKFYFSYENGYEDPEMTPSADFKAALDQLESDFGVAINNGLTLTGNFQSEYDTYTTVSQKIFYESIESR